jgi:hypothetical protein
MTLKLQTNSNVIPGKLAIAGATRNPGLLFVARFAKGDIEWRSALPLSRLSISASRLLSPVASGKVFIKRFFDPNAAINSPCAARI